MSVTIRSNFQLSLVAKQTSPVLVLSLSAIASTLPIKRSQAFTLLEVMIALTLVAVLMAAAIPYMTDAFGKNQGEQISAAVATLVEQTRTAALTAGESKYIEFTESTFSQIFPQGWKFQIERMNDKKFRDPNNGETWEFNNEGICDPLTVRLLGPGTPITMKFDPITGDVIHDD